MATGGSCARHDPAWAEFRKAHTPESPMREKPTLRQPRTAEDYLNAAETRRRWEKNKFFELSVKEQQAGRDPRKAFEDRGWEP